MGLAASQGRYLSLTARNSDLIYEGQQISQQKLALADKTQEITNKYTEAMNNKVMNVTTADGVTQRLSYDIITNENPYTGLGMRLVDANGNVVMPGEYIEVSSKEKEDVTDGEEYLNDRQNKPIKYVNKDDFISRYFVDASGDELTELHSKSLSELCEYYNQSYPDSGLSVTYKDKYNSKLVGENDHVINDPNCMDSEYLHKMITTGQWFLQQANPSVDEGWDEIIWQSSTALSEVYDTTDDAAAEAEYQAAMTKLQKQDKLLDLRLEQVQTEQGAVEKEMESIKQIIDKNIESSFKTFS